MIESGRRNRPDRKGEDIAAKSAKKAGFFTRAWDRVSSPWRWTLLAAIPGTAIGGMFVSMGIVAIIGECPNCTGYGIVYTASGILMLVGAPAITMLSERRMERRMELLETPKGSPGQARQPTEAAPRRGKNSPEACSGN